MGNLERHRFVGRTCEDEFLRAERLYWFFRFACRKLLQLLVQLSCLLQFHCQILAAELEAPVESDGEGTEGDDSEGFEEINDRKLITLHATAQHEVAIETDAQCHERCVD